MSSATQEVFPKLSGPCRETGETGDSAFHNCLSHPKTSKNNTSTNTRVWPPRSPFSFSRFTVAVFVQFHLSISSLEPYRAICPGSLVASPSICRDLNLVRSACLGRWENFEGYQTGCDPHGESASATKPGIAAQDFDCTQGPKWKLGLKKHRKHLVDALSEEKPFEIS